MRILFQKIAKGFFLVKTKPDKSKTGKKNVIWKTTLQKKKSFGKILLFELYAHWNKKKSDFFFVWIIFVLTENSKLLWSRNWYRY